MSSNQLTLQSILVGNSGIDFCLSGCGKSTILKQYATQRSSHSDSPTIGIEYGSKQLKISHKKVLLKIWDTGGQQSYRSVIRGYYKRQSIQSNRAIIAFIVFDVTDKQSFEDIRYWHHQTTSNGDSQIKIYLIGNKSDLINQNQRVEITEISQLVQKLKLCAYFEVSAKRNVGIQQIFKTAVQETISDIEKGKIKLKSNTENVQQLSSNAQKKGGCLC